MEPMPYSAHDLWRSITGPGGDFLLLDVRNSKDFKRFQVEGPSPIAMLNVPYMEFVEFEEASVARVPRGKPMRIVCAKEGSAKYVASILLGAGYEDVAYLAGGIKSWGNMLVERTVAENGYTLYQFLRPAKASCGYGLAFGKELMLFDPSRNAAFYTSLAKGRGLDIIATCETHLQADYIAGSHAIAKATGAVFYAPPDDFADAAYAHVPARDGDVLAFSGSGPEVRVMHTPGHTPGSTCYLVDNTYLIAGDTVFVLSVGRPDLGGKAEEWSRFLFHTLTRTIGALDDSTLALPAHFAQWGEARPDLVIADTLGAIRERNKEIYFSRSESDFYAFIKDNMREQPPEYATIRLVNAGLKVVDEEEQEILDLGKNECAASGAH